MVSAPSLSLFCILLVLLDTYLCALTTFLDLMFGGGRGECEGDDKRRSVMGTGENIEGMLKRRHSEFGSSYALFQSRLPL